MNIGGETQKGTNVAFEINNNNSDLRAFLMQHEQYPYTHTVVSSLLS